MTTRKRNIYPIRHLRRPAYLVLLAAAVALAPTSAFAQCKDVGGAGDEYCESIPGPGGDREAGPPRREDGLSDATSRALELAGAGAVRQVQSPERERGPKRQPQTASATPDPRISEAGGGSVLPYLLAGLTLALLLAALVRRRGGSASPQDPAT